MKRPGYHGGLWPDDRQEDVLRAALAPGRAGVEAWQRLRPQIDLDDIWDPEVHRLLPLVYTNLRAAGASDPDLPRLKGLYRRTWYLNQMKLHEIVPWLAELRAAGIDVMLLKGVPLGLLHYRDLGQRPMADVDVLVPVAQADRALDLLESRGWRDMGGVPRDRLWRRYHGSGLRHPSGAELDVHWILDEAYLLPDERRSSDAFWKASVPLELEGVDCRALCASDTLLHAIVHGTWSGSAATTRWVADAMTILRTAPEGSGGDQLDWDRFVAQVRERRLSLHVADPLRYLAERFDAPVPSHVHDAVAAERTTRRERRLHRAMTAGAEGPAVLGGLPHMRAYWAHTRQRWTTGRALREAPGFVEDLWGLAHIWEIPGDVARKAWRRLRGADRAAAPARGGVPRLGLSVLVPTLRRPELLGRCLDALVHTDRPPEQIVVVVRRDDHDTMAELERRADQTAIEVVQVDRPGLVTAYRVGLPATTNEIVAFVDDDAAPHHDWATRLRLHFADPAVGAVGGRDLLTIDGRRVEGRSRVVGIIRPWGRVVGNHETGVGKARRVDHLKGCNLAVRRDLLRLPDGLRGEGATVYNELAVCLAVRDQGYDVVYDPDLLVDHTWGPRFDSDRRDAPTMQARANAVYNQSYILFSMRPRLRLPRLAYVVLVGDRGNGGALRCAYARVTGDRDLRGVFRPYLRAHLEAWRAARRSPLVLDDPLPATTAHAH